MLVYKQLQDSVIRQIHEELETRENDKFELRNGIVYRNCNDEIFFYISNTIVHEIIRIYHNEVGHIELEDT